MIELPANLHYMLKPAEQTHVTEHYVSSPPALWVIDERGDVWTLGMTMQRHDTPRGEFAFPVLRNALPVGEYASRIERRGGKIRIFCRDGWKRWTGVSFF